MYSIFNVRYKTGRGYRVPLWIFSALCDFFRIFLSPKDPPSVFLIFCNKLDFQKARSPHFTILKTLRFLSFRYSTDLRRSRLFYLLYFGQFLTVTIVILKFSQKPWFSSFAYWADILWISLCSIKNIPILLNYFPIVNQNSEQDEFLFKLKCFKLAHVFRSD